jgi:zinc protease
MLSNGMQICVIPDHRVPVVTHMVWYRVGAADDPLERSGLAHFLEHLMFKGTRTIESGAFTRIVSGLGGRHNALTTHDTTSYFQRVAKPHLKRLMELEADRMVNLQLTEAEVTTERGVVREERRGSVDGAPISALNEQMLAILYQNHPYRRPVLGWPHEIAKLSLSDAEQFYKRHYAPNNAILVVAGDVTPGEVLDHALETYGRVPPGPPIAERRRPEEPKPVSPRWVQMEDARIGAPMVLRYYSVPGVDASGKDRAVLSVLARVLGGDDTSRLYRQLVLDKKIAVHAGADFQSGGRDSTRLAVLALAAGNEDTRSLEAAIDDVIAVFLKDGVTEDELARAKLVLEAHHVFDTDDQEKRARRYGMALATGGTLRDVDDEPARIAAVSAADVLAVARAYLDRRRSVTGVLVKPTAVPADRPADATAGASRP